MSRGLAGKAWARAAPDRGPQVHRRGLGLGFYAGAVALALIVSLAVAGVFEPRPLLNRNGWPLVWQFVRAAVHPDLGRDTLALALDSTLVTLAFAVCGTSLALVIGLVGGILSSEVLWLPEASAGGAPARSRGVARRVLRRAAWVAVRVTLAVPRAVHEVIWGLFFVNILGLDPMVAILAIALPFGAVTSKVFGEILDETPREAFAALRASGASPLAAFLYGVLPQAFPDLLSYAFYRFECAIRAAAILGLIGAGGLGYQILLSLQSLEYAQIWTFLYALVLLGGSIDALSSFLHRRLHLPTRIDLNVGRHGSQRPLAFRIDPVARAALLGVALLIPLSFWYVHPDAARLFSPRTLALLGGALGDAWPPRLEPALLGRLGHLSIDTLAMSIIAMALAGAGGLVVSFPAAPRFALPGGLLDAAGPSGDAPGRGRRKTGRGPSAAWLRGLVVLGGARGALLFARALSEAIWALLVLFLLFPGVLPGAVALGLYNLGVLGRLMAETHDNLDPRPLRALQAQGASPAQVFLYGVLPRTLPRCLAYLFYRWEVCIRATVVVGLVGAGGLGRVLSDQLSSFDYRGVVTTLSCLSLLTLAVDLVGAHVRRRLR